MELPAVSAKSACCGKQSRSEPFLKSRRAMAEASRRSCGRSHTGKNRSSASEASLAMPVPDARDRCLRRRSGKSRRTRWLRTGSARARQRPLARPEREITRQAEDRHRIAIRYRRFAEFRLGFGALGSIKPRIGLSGGPVPIGWSMCAHFASPSAKVTIGTQPRTARVPAMSACSVPASFRNTVGVIFLAAAMQKAGIGTSQGLRGERRLISSAVETSSPSETRKLCPAAASCSQAAWIRLTRLSMPTTLRRLFLIAGNGMPSPAARTSSLMFAFAPVP